MKGARYANTINKGTTVKSVMERVYVNIIYTDRHALYAIPDVLVKIVIQLASGIQGLNPIVSGVFACLILMLKYLENSN